MIGTEIAVQAAQVGHEVTIFSRGVKRRTCHLSVNAIYGDRKNREEFKYCLKGLKFDAVIDMAAYCPQDAAQTLAAFDGQVEHIVFASSVAAYQQPYGLLPLKEKDAVLRTDRQFAYGFQKAEMERFLTACVSHSHLTVLRPSLTYGVEGHNVGVLRQNANLAVRIKSGKPLLLFGDGLNPCHFTFVGDMARAFVLTLFNPLTYGRCFHVASDETKTWQEFYSAIATLAGEPLALCYLPSQALFEANPILFGHVYFEKRFCSLYDCSAFREAVPAWTCKLHLKEGVKQLYAWWESENFPIDIEKDHLEDSLCEIALEQLAQLRVSCGMAR